MVVLAFHLAWIGVLFARGYEIRDFIGLGRIWIERGGQTELFHVDPHYHYVANGIGYDGQWAYYIALDPTDAAAHIDGPSYRYGRILYPLLARVLALGHARLIPWSLLAVNLIAVAGGTLALAKWLSRGGYSAWLAAVFGLYPGLVVSLHRDLTEVVALALVALAAYLLPATGVRRQLAAAAFALAILARETTAVFAIAAAAGLLLDGEGGLAARIAANWRGVAGFVLVALLPFVAWEVFVIRWLGPVDTGQAGRFEVIPLKGMLDARPWRADHLRVAISVILPGLLCGGGAVVSLARRRWDWVLLALLLNVFLFVLFLPRQSYVDPEAALRVTSAIVLAALLSLPVLARGPRRVPAWFLGVSALWLISLPLTFALNLRDHPTGLIRV
jgi:hypothetical protein